MEKNKKIIIGIVVVVILLLIIGLIYFLMNRTYTVTFDSNGGSAVESQIVKRNETATEPEDPIMEGYQFDGWYYADRQDERYNFATKVTEDITLIAKWIEEDVAISEVRIHSEKSTIQVGEELVLTLEISPEDIDQEDLEITWSSSDETIATVSENGTVTGLKPGIVTITVTVNGISTSFELTIVEEGQEATTTTASISDEDTSQKPSNNAGTNDNSNIDTEEPEQTPAPKPGQDPEPEIPQEEVTTYTYEWVRAEESVAGQYRLYIVSSKGEHVAGTVTITQLSGRTSTESIPTSGKVYVKDSITNVSNVKPN